MMKATAVLALLAMMGLSACLPVTSNAPVGSTIGFRPDPALLGTWRARGSDADAPSYVHILANEDKTMSAVLISPPHGENGGDWSVYTLRATTLGHNHILNAQERITNGKPSDGPLALEHVVLLYRASGADRLTLYQMDDKAVAAAIKAGEITGQVEPGEQGDVRITASEAALDKFMTTPRAAALFSKPLVTLTRVL